MYTVKKSDNFCSAALMEPILESPGADGGTKSEGEKEEEEVLGAQVDRSSSPFFSGGTAATSQKKKSEIIARNG